MSDASGMAASAVFDFAGCRVEVDPLSRVHLQWLEEFLCPAFSRADDSAQEPDHRVRLRIDPAGYRRLYAGGPDGRFVDAFVLDQGVVGLPTWNHGGDGVVAFDESTLVFYEVSGDRVTVLSEIDRPAVRIAVMRAIRELASTHAVDSGGLLLHAAAFVLDGRAAILAGPKRAGKTTLLLQALDSGRARYVANDRVLLSIGADGPLAHGMPTIVSIRADTLPLLPRLAGAIQHRRYDFRSTVAEVQRAARIQVGATPQLSLTTAQLCALTGSRALGAAVPTLILFPEIDPERRSPGLTPLGPEVRSEYLRTSLFGAPHAGRKSVLFASAGRLDHGAAPGPSAGLLPASVRWARIRPATAPLGGKANLDLIAEYLG
jgi:hypothetical protein